jgi:hypothetical protein
MLAGFLSTFIIHPILIAIYESGWHFPLRGTAHKKTEDKTSLYTYVCGCERVCVFMNSSNTREIQFV